MPITGIETVISAAGIVSECLLVLAWLIRGRKRPLWIIGFYAVYHLLVTISLRFLHLRRHDLRDSLFFAHAAIDFALLTGIVVELFVYTAKPFAEWPRATKRSLSLYLAAGTLIPIVFVTFLKFKGLQRVEVWDARLDILTSTLLCTYVLASRSTDIQLHTRKNAAVEVMSLGLAGWTGFALAVDLLHMVSGWKVSPIFDEGTNAVWVLMILFWAVVAWKSGPLPTPLHQVDSHQVDLHQVN